MDFGESSDPHGCWIWDSAQIGDAGIEFVSLDDRCFVTVDVDLTQDSSVKGAASHTQEEGPRSPTPGQVRRTLEAPGMRAPNPESNRERTGEGAEHGRAAFGANNEPDSLLARGLDETDAIAAAIAERFPLADAVVRIRYAATEAQHRRVDQAALHRLLEDAGIHRLHGGLQWIPVRESRARVQGFTEALPPLAAVDLWLAANAVDEAQAGSLRALLAGYLEAEA